MLKRTFARGFIFFLLILVWNSCTKDYVNHNLPSPPAPQDTTVVELSFEGRIIPIFQDNCVECHTAIDVLDLTPENAYTDLWAKNEIDTLVPENSNLYLRLTSQTMPMPQTGNLPTDTIQVVLQWIKEGAKNN